MTDKRMKLDKEDITKAFKGKLRGQRNSMHKTTNSMYIKLILFWLANCILKKKNIMDLLHFGERKNNNFNNLILLLLL